MRVTEIFTSIQGEGTRAGRPCTFVRLTGCDLRCSYCDTTYAFSGGQRRSVDAIVEDIEQRGCRLVCVTGGEPLLQPEAIELMRRLVQRRFEVVLETGGHRPVREVPAEVVKVLDVKTPGCGVGPRGFDEGNLEWLLPHDEVKFVVTDRADFDWAIDFARRHDLAARVAAVFVSPAWGLVDPGELAQWLLEMAGADGFRIQIQLHKVLWGDVPGR